MQHERIDALLATCLDQPATAWSEEVEAACAAHPELAAELRRRFDKLVALGLLDPERIEEDEPGPERLGHYRLLRRLGGGGMGVVYEAHDEKLDRRVALKVIRGEQLFFQGSRDRFRLEMRAASRLDHPNLCPVYEAGEIDGVPYLAMRFVAGTSLAALLDERRRERATTSGRTGVEPERRRLEMLAWIEKIAGALHAAHEAGLVHRDVKPSNILIDAAGEPVLVDFGLARELGRAGAGLTRTGERLGTPAYMAPEQVSGDGAAVDRRTDVYALGATLYECLTLRCPFEAATTDDLYRRILSDPAADPRQFDRGVGRELAIVLAKALEKNPAHRFPDAATLAEELRRIRQHEPIASRRPSAWTRSVRWYQRNRAAAAVLAITLLGLCVALWLLRQSQRAADHYLALAWLRAAGEVEEQDPELAFKCARQALRLHDDPQITAKIQEIMFQLRGHTRLGGQRAHQARFSPSGEIVVVTLPGHPAALFRRGAQGWRPVEFEDTDPAWRATSQFHPPPAAFSPDDHELALRGPFSRTVHRYDLRSDPPAPLGVLAFDGPANVWSVHYHPGPNDGRFLVVQDRVTSVWRRDGTHVADLQVDDAQIWTQAAFLPGGRIVAAGALWRADHSLLHQLPASRGFISHVLVADERFLTVSSSRPKDPPETLIRSFDFDGVLEGRLSLPPRDWNDAVSTVEVDRSGTRLLISNGDRIRLFDTRSLDAVGGWSSGACLPTDARFSPDGRIAAYDGRGRIRIWDRDGSELDTFAGQGMSGSVDWSPRRDELVSATGSSVRLWTFDVRRGVRAFVGLGKPDVVASPGGDLVVFTSNTKRRLYLCDANGRLLRESPDVDLGTGQARFVRERLVAVASELRRTFFTWDVSAARVRELAAPVPLGDCPPALLADGRWLLQANRFVCTWNPGDGETRAALDFHEPSLHLAVSTDGEQVVFATFGEPDGHLRFHPIEGKPRWYRTGAEFTVLSRDGRHVLAADASGSAYLWEVGDAERPAQEYVGHQAPLVGAAFSVDEARIATAAQDGAIRIWDRGSGQTIQRLHHLGVRRVVFTRSGSLVSAGTDGTVRWWCIDLAPLQAAVREVDIGEMTDAEHNAVSHLLGQR